VKRRALEFPAKDFERLRGLKDVTFNQMGKLNEYVTGESLYSSAGLKAPGRTKKENVSSKGCRDST